MSIEKSNLVLKRAKKYKPKLEVMKYTINEMSFKSNLKALGSVDKWLQDGTHNGIETYKERLLRGSDFELHYINEKIRSKFRSAMKTIYRAQEKNEKEKNELEQKWIRKYSKSNNILWK